MQAIAPRQGRPKNAATLHRYSLLVAAFAACTALRWHMEELEKLNRHIAAHWLGILDTDHEAYLSYTSVCIGQFTHSAAELAQFLACSMGKHRNSLSVAKLNRQYLRFARLAAKDVAAGKLEMLVRLGITLEQAEVLGNLTNDAVNWLSFGWDGAIISFESEALNRGVVLHADAAQHHATAYVATRFSM